MSAIWQNVTVQWKTPKSWIPPLSRWLRPFLNTRGIRYLRRLGEQDICWDDSHWLKKAQTILRYDVEYVIEGLGDALSVATVRRARHSGTRRRVEGGAFADIIDCNSER